MFKQRSFRLFATLVVLLVAVFAASAIHSVPAVAKGNGPAAKSTTPAYWWWGESAGRGTVVRTAGGVTGNMRTSMVTSSGQSLAGKAMTLWVVVFNNPDACTTGPGVPKCTDQDVFDPVMGPPYINKAVQPDFLYAAGHVVGAGRSGWGGHVKANGPEGVYGSGLGELICGITGCGDPSSINTPGLQNPETAEIHLVVHDHGDALTGQALQQQIKHFIDPYCSLPPGFGQGPDDDMDCDSIQFSVHQVD